MLYDYYYYYYMYMNMIYIVDYAPVYEEIAKLLEGDSLADPVKDLIRPYQNVEDHAV